MKKPPDWREAFRGWAKPGYGSGAPGGADERTLAPAVLKGASGRLAPGKPILVAAPMLAMAERLALELKAWSSAARLEIRVESLPEGSKGGSFVSGEEERSRVLHGLLTNPPDILVASAASILAPAPSPERMRDLELRLKPGLELPLSKLVERLVGMDYDDEPEVSVPGEFARRGGIVDAFSPVHAKPVRVEYWGDTIESLREFSPESQLSLREIAEYRLIVRSGAAASEEQAGDLRAYLPGLDQRLFVAFPEECLKHVSRFGGEGDLARWESLLKACPGRLEILDVVEAAARPESVHCGCLQPAAHILEAVPEGAEDSFGELTRQLTASQIRQWLDCGSEVAILGAGEGDMIHIRQWLEESGLAKAPGIALDIANLPSGLYIPEAKLAVLTERELFATPRRLRSAKPMTEHSEGAKAPEPETQAEAGFLADLDEGDMAVHVNYGICVYKGLREVESLGMRQELIELEFADDAIVHVPIWQAHAVGRYVGAKKGAVPLSKIGSARWSKAKEAASKSVKSLALDMLRIQAVRSAAEGFAFPHDELQQRLFEQAFPYEETPDQGRAAEEIKRDMEASKSMDRLLCGDVGYGKTEVAMRAAFKCVAAGRQVAVLVPTTILAQQHYYSFRERFAEHPVTIETLSRFKSKAEQKEIIERLQGGSIDIIIGTHRLVQGDVKLRDLGLVIIDEEQRFGVVHKERLKSLRATVDILTMTATPIPRTLYMSMAGIRDLSTIMNAPVQRLPVQTVVAQDDDAIIGAAIAREIQRGGQVFLLHNRVESIELACKRVASLAPEARLGIAHGRMHEDDLEQVMSRFLEGKIDVLVCTTIIESGLDIPNANTIIIDRADRFGLAELYQLRGRVGRWNRQAYAYLLLPKSGILSDDARRRIAAIRRYTHLGAGFKLALRDLEIRGSGNILGSEQSGHISAVGFDLYCQMLRAIVAQVKGGGARLEARPETDLNVDFLAFALEAPKDKAPASFPTDYINSERHRIEAYRKLSSLSSPEEIDAFAKGLSDRFGKPPRQALNLLKAAKIRAAASAAGFNAVSVKESKLIMERSGLVHKGPDGRIPSIDRSLPPEKRLEQLLNLVIETSSRLKPAPRMPQSP